MYLLIISKSNLVLNSIENVYIINERSLYMLFFVFVKELRQFFYMISKPVSLPVKKIKSYIFELKTVLDFKRFQKISKVFPKDRK